MKVLEVVAGGVSGTRFNLAMQMAIQWMREIHKVECELERSNNLPAEHDNPRGLFNAISNADLVVAYLCEKRFAELYELGIADALKKPIVLVTAPDTAIPHSFVGRRKLVADEKDLHEPHVLKAIYNLVRDALESPSPFQAWGDRNVPRQRVPAFICYSHKDKACLDRLEVHLKPLYRDGLIDPWSDKRLDSGDEWRKQIDEALKNARIAVLLVSADFLASDFIMDNELPPLLIAAGERGVRILPVLLSPSRFSRDKILSRFQALNSPSKPLLGLPPFEQEELYNRLAAEIEQFVQRGDGA